jgi:hypothetical protein
VLKKLYSPAAKAGGKVLVDLLAATPSYDVQQLATVLAAIKNAGPSVVPPSKIVEKAIRLFRKGMPPSHGFPFAFVLSQSELNYELL